MIRRILRSITVLAALIAAYQAYVLFAVPRMEPSLEIQQQRRASDEELNHALKSVSKYQRLLSSYFPKNHWTQTRPPKVFASSTEQAMLVIDDFTRQDAATAEYPHGAKVDIKQFLMLFFPTPPHEGIAAPRDAIIIETTQGAYLVFDEFHPEMGKIGQITHGEFPGPIVIRSDMHEPGPDDDLLVETSDLRMNTKLLYTDAPVRFRMGQNIGGGRELEIRFLADEHAQAHDAALKIAGFDTLEIRRDVRMRMQLDTASLLPGGKKDSAKTASAQQKTNAGQNPAVQVNDPKFAPPVPKPPVDVTCNGPFTFDFVRYVASVDRDVLVRQLNPEGPCDQLTCNQLDIHFAPKVDPDAKPDPILVDPGKRQQRDLGRLEAVALVAQGHPAIAVSPVRKSEARGDRIQIALREQRLRIEGGADAMVSNGANVLRGPIIDYESPDKESDTQIGRFRATGPGSLHFVASPDKPDQVLEAAWQKSVQMGRDKGQPVIVMEGRPEIAFAASGGLRGDQIRIYLRELDAASSAGMQLGGTDKQKQTKLAPDRLIALGRVEIATPQLNGHTQQLIANFRLQPSLAQPSTPAAAQYAVMPNSAAQNSASNPATNKQSVKAAPVSQSTPRPEQPSGGDSQQKYQIDANQMQLEVLLEGQTTVPSTLACDGNIVLRQISQQNPNEQPVELRGAQLLVTQLESKTPHVTLKGATAAASGTSGHTAPVGSPLAQLAGKGVNLFGAMFEMDGRENRMWNDGPGDATMLMNRDLQGNASATPTPVKIHWQGGLRFDGRVVTFDRDVVVTSADSTMHCSRLLATLEAPIQFGQKVDQTATSVSQIDCEAPVTIDNVSRDTSGVTSHDRMQLGHLTIDQHSGDIRGEGPGVIRSTRYGGGLGSVASTDSAQRGRQTQTAADSSKLHFLRVDFHTGLKGNIYTKELTFIDRVRSVYGPVDSWEQELELTRPETLPPESMTLTSDELRVNEDPLAPHSQPGAANGTGIQQSDYLQMQARGDVRIWGQTLAQGEFSIQADEASYDKHKDMFILTGNTRTPAKLWRRKAGADAPPLEARRISFTRSTNQADAKVDGLQYLEITPADVPKQGIRPATKPATR
jgi:hypothetical protein